MQLDLSMKQFRRLLDMVYIGNWVLNAPGRGDRIEEFDQLQSKLFEKCRHLGMENLTECIEGTFFPSKAFAEGGIHEAIMAYEDTVFFEILAEELARRDVIAEGGDGEDLEQIRERIGVYIDEFELNGTDNIELNL